MYRLPIYEVRLHHTSDVSVPTLRVDSSQGGARVFRAVLSDLPHEEMWVLPIDGCNRPRGLTRVSMGGAHGTAVTPSDVLRVVLASGCRAYLIAHNHPSGDPTPSSEDVAMTRSLVAAGRIVDVILLDHLVIAEGGYRSLTEMGYCDEGGEP